MAPVGGAVGGDCQSGNATGAPIGVAMGRPVIRYRKTINADCVTVPSTDRWGNDANRRGFPSTNARHTNVDGPIVTGSSTATQGEGRRADEAEIGESTVVNR